MWHAARRNIWKEPPAKTSENGSRKMKKGRRGRGENVGACMIISGSGAGLCTLCLQGRQADMRRPSLAINPQSLADFLYIRTVVHHKK